MWLRVLLAPPEKNSGGTITPQPPVPPIAHACINEYCTLMQNVNFNYFNYCGRKAGIDAELKEVRSVVNEEATDDEEDGALSPAGVEPVGCSRTLRSLPRIMRRSEHKIKQAH